MRPRRRWRGEGPWRRQTHAASAAGSGCPMTMSRADRMALRLHRAIRPDHHALLLINPHTSFFFRWELQMRSDEGLDAYGAVTWGQFFVYQGFNERAGWMHTSSGVDAVDEYLETVTQNGASWSYIYGGEQRPVIERQIALPTGLSMGWPSGRLRRCSRSMGR